MSRRTWISASVLGAALLGLACDEITTSTRSGQFVVTISIAESPFITSGDTLVDDTPRFAATVTEGGREIPTSGQRFESDNSSVVQVDASTGEAVFRSVGRATVTVTFDEPRVLGPDPLSASIDVRVTEYTLEFALTSTLTGEAISSDDALVNDVVRVSAVARKDTVTRTATGVEIKSSSDTNVIDPDAASAPDEAVLTGSGTATLTVSVDEPAVPGGELEGTIDVNVKDFVVNIEAASLVEGSTSLADGDVLVTDSVQYSATVVKAVDDTIPTTGATWSSSDESVVEFVDAAAGVARFVGTGVATVSVDFADPELPGAPFGEDVTVTTLDTQIELESLVTGPGALGDTLVTDSVGVSVAVTKDGQSRASTLSLVESSDSSVADPVALGDVVFADTGAASLIVTLAQPQLPKRVLVDTLDLRVTTFTVTIDSVTDASPTMGDTLRFFATAMETRNDTEILSPTLNFGSSDSQILRFLDATAGRALARDTGSAAANVTLVDPGLPRGSVTDAFPVIDITEERFYGIADTLRGDFGDTVIVAASEVHVFTDSTRVFFPNETVGFVDSVTTDTLRFIVGAGTDEGPLLILNLEDDMGAPRDSVLTRFSFVGLGGVDDPFEPNDVFPLDPAKDRIDVPFEAFLSIDPSKTAPPDTNFFYVRIPSGAALTVNVMAEWQQPDGDIDFFVCNATGGTADDPPDGYDPGACSRPEADNSSVPSDEVEQALGVTLGVGRHVFAFYCPAGNCPAIPLTYKVTIEEQ